MPRKVEGVPRKIAKAKGATKPKRLEVVLANVKVTLREKRIAQDKADYWTNGNLSAWIRYAVLNCEPKPEHLNPNHPDNQG